MSSYIEYVQNISRIIRDVIIEWCTKKEETARKKSVLEECETPKFYRHVCDTMSLLLLRLRNTYWGIHETIRCQILYQQCKAKLLDRLVEIARAILVAFNFFLPIYCTHVQLRVKSLLDMHSPWQLPLSCLFPIQDQRHLHEQKTRKASPLLHQFSIEHR